MIAVRKRLSPSVQSLFSVRWSNIKLSRAWLTMDETVVSVTQGKLRGAVQKNVLGSSYIAFKGIPFAAPPVGNLRFKDPQLPAPWSGIKDTSQDVGYFCTQLEDYPPHRIYGDEDCLYLNVYTNSLNESKPVMFWIHGGAFTIGSSSFTVIRPDYLLARDVVLVTSNYRLGAFGFLNLNHQAAPGNMGMKDLIMALEWVKENIANFGGDPSNVTIFGASAGGSLAHALTISPRSKGLFHKAIFQSGLLNCQWSSNQSLPERGFKLASILGENSKDPEEVVEFLRTIPAAKIVEAQSFILRPEEKLRYSLPFGLNTDQVAENPVLPLPIEQLQLNDADIPIIAGYASHEAIMFVADNSQKAMHIYNISMPIHANNMGSLKKLSSAEIEELLKSVKNLYFDGQAVTADNLAKYIELTTDVYFAVPTMIFLEDRATRKSSPNYLYRYSYVGSQKALTDLMVKRIMSGASHVDELPYLFYYPLYKTEDPEPPAVGTKDRINIERLTRLWTNFAKTGNPTSVQDEFVTTTWKPLTSDELNYLDIGDDMKSLVAEPHILSNKS